MSHEKPSLGPPAFDFNYAGSKEINRVRLALFVCEGYMEGKRFANGTQHNISSPPLLFCLKSLLFTSLCIPKMETTDKTIAEQVAGRLSNPTPMQQVINPTPMQQQVINPTPMQQVIKPTPIQQAINPTPMQQALNPEFTNKFNQVPLQQLIKRDRGMMTLSDDNMMVKQIHETHAPDGREFNVRPLFQLVEDILNRATLTVDPLTSVKHCYSLSLFMAIHFVYYVAPFHPFTTSARHLFSKDLTSISKFYNNTSFEMLEKLPWGEILSFKKIITSTIYFVLLIKSLQLTNHN